MVVAFIKAPTADELFAVGIVWATVCTIVVSLRFAARRYQRLGLLADDWLTIPAWVCILNSEIKTLMALGWDAWDMCGSGIQ